MNKIHTIKQSVPQKLRQNGDSHVFWDNFRHTIV